jgi:site-specific DNA-methyltransferase (adenine-specific)
VGDQLSGGVVKLTPYYEDDFVTIYHGDCREVLPRINADVAVTDPPYGVGVDYDGHDDTTEALEALIADVWPLMERFDRVALTPGVGNIHRWPAPRWTLCWFDPGGVGSGPWGFCTWQPVLVYGKDPFLQDGKGRRPDGLMLMQRGDPDGTIKHPCPKPVDLMRWVIARVAPRSGEVIVDPFMGSGTTLRAAKDLGRKVVGIDQSERYCEIAAKRMAQEVLDFGGAA